MKALQKKEKVKKVRTKSSRRLRKEKIGSGLYLAPSLLGVLLFYIHWWITRSVRILCFSKTIRE